MASIMENTALFGTEQPAYKYLLQTNNYISLAGHGINNFLKTLDDIEKDFCKLIRFSDNGEDFPVTYLEENY